MDKPCKYSYIHDATDSRSVGCRSSYWPPKFTQSAVRDIVEYGIQRMTTKLSNDYVSFEP
jgi:hypothetical protein